MHSVIRVAQDIAPCSCCERPTYLVCYKHTNVHVCTHCVCPVCLPPEQYEQADPEPHPGLWQRMRRSTFDWIQAAAILVVLWLAWAFAVAVWDDYRPATHAITMHEEESR